MPFVRYLNREIINGPTKRQMIVYWDEQDERECGAILAFAIVQMTMVRKCLLGGCQGTPSKHFLTVVICTTAKARIAPHSRSSCSPRYTIVCRFVGPLTISRLRYRTKGIHLHLGFGQFLGPQLPPCRALGEDAAHATQITPRISLTRHHQMVASREAYTLPRFLDQKLMSIPEFFALRF